MLLVYTPVVLIEIDNAVLNVTLIKPKVNTNTFDVKLSIKSSDTRRV